MQLQYQIITIFVLQWITLQVSHAQWYDIKSYQDEYQELEDYNSWITETLDIHIDGEEFDFGFEFPYFDSTYTSMTVTSNTAAWHFDGANSWASLFSFGYVLDDASRQPSLDSLYSDIRFQWVDANGLKAFVIQWTHVRLRSHQFVGDYDSYLNFQQWAYEDGSIEIRIGPYDLDNSPNYVPGEGFIYIVSEDERYHFGPQCSMRSPDQEYAVGIIGDYDDYEVVPRTGDYITTMPPEGWVIRFEHLKTNTDEIDITNSDLRLSPNPVVDSLGWKPPKSTIVWRYTITMGS